MLNTLVICGSVLAAIAILFVSLFIHFGQRWNDDLGKGSNDRKP